MIGIFDSGLGGLTILKAFNNSLPQADFVYLGDNRNAPYGTRPSLDVLTLTCVGVERLFNHGCQLVIISCNTASTVALHWIQQNWLPQQNRGDGLARNVLGIVVPTIEQVTNDKATINSVAIFATERTVLSETYPAELLKRQPALRVYQQACPLLVGLIENGAPTGDVQTLVKKYVQDLYEQMGRTYPDRVILACTHYALIAPLFAAALPAGTVIINQQEAVATALADYITRHPAYVPTAMQGRRTLLATANSPDLQTTATRFFGSPIRFEVV